MKTTIEVDDAVWKKARMRAIEEGRSTSRLLEDAIHLYIGKVIPEGAVSFTEVKRRKPKKGGSR